MRQLAWSAGLAGVLLASGCASTPRYAREECPLYTELGPLTANPAGALERRLRVEVAFRVCPPVDGLAEIQRKRIELRHHVLALLSSKTAAELNNPQRVEALQREIQEAVNQKVLRKSRVVDVYITGFDLQ